MPFLDDGNGPIFGLSLLIDKINGENAKGGLCTFGVLHLVWASKVEVFSLIPLSLVPALLIVIVSLLLHYPFHVHRSVI